jgi:hypothetical protein
MTACGGSSSSSDNGVAAKSPADIVSAASQAIDGVTSVHVSGSDASGSSPIKLDLSLVAGKGGTGQLTINGSTFQIVDIGQTVYLKAGSDFWNQFGNASATKLLSGKWLKASATGRFASFAELTNLHTLFNQLLSKHGTLVKGSTTSLNGEKVIAVKDTTKSGTLYVATTGKPYPVEIAKSGSGGGQITFDRINQNVSLSAPSGAITIPGQ